MVKKMSCVFRARQGAARRLLAGRGGEEVRYLMEVGLVEVEVHLFAGELGINGERPAFRPAGGGELVGSLPHGRPQASMSAAVSGSFGARCARDQISSSFSAGSRALPDSVRP